MNIINKHNAASALKGVLNAGEVMRIKQGLGKGDHPSALARLFGVSEQTITRIRDGKTWAWVKTDEEIFARPVMGKELPVEDAQKSLAEVMRRINEGQTAGEEGAGSGLAALGEALTKEKKGNEMLGELVQELSKRGEGQ